MRLLVCAVWYVPCRGSHGVGSRVATGGYLAACIALPRRMTVLPSRIDRGTLRKITSTGPMKFLYRRCLRCREPFDQFGVFSCMCMDRGIRRPTYSRRRRHSQLFGSVHSGTQYVREMSAYSASCFAIAIAAP